MAWVVLQACGSRASVLALRRLRGTSGSARPPWRRRQRRGGAVAAASPTKYFDPRAVDSRMMLVVAVALLNSKGQVLLAQRPPGKRMEGLWEFPGGKVEPGESPEAALVRELHEELRVEVESSDLKPLTFASHSYYPAPAGGAGSAAGSTGSAAGSGAGSGGGSGGGGAAGSFHLLMPLYACVRWRGEPVGAEGQAVAWVGEEALSGYAMPPADAPLLPHVRAAMRCAAGGGLEPAALAGFLLQ